MMQLKFCTICGLLGGVLSWCFGSWDAALQALIICMGIDYLSGVLVAGVFRHSLKSENGGLCSRIGFQGLVRKGMILLIVLIAHRLDLIVGGGWIRDGVCAAFLANELVSILENAGMMGIPFPKALQNAIDILKSKGDEKHD